jgi:hypothetical protein
VTAIIELLERYLAAAKADRLTGIAISATVPMGKYQHHFAGDVPAEPAQLKSVLELADKLQWSVDNWQPLATDSGKTIRRCFRIREGDIVVPRKTTPVMGHSDALFTFRTASNHFH